MNATALGAVLRTGRLQLRTGVRGKPPQQGQIAQLVGVDKKMYSIWERGERGYKPPSRGVLMKIADVLQLPLGKVLGETERDPQLAEERAASKIRMAQPGRKERIGEFNRSPYVPFYTKLGLLGPKRGEGRGVAHQFVGGRDD